MSEYIAVTAVATGEFLAHWWVFPAAVLFPTVALASDVANATPVQPTHSEVVDSAAGGVQKPS